MSQGFRQPPATLAGAAPQGRQNGRQPGSYLLCLLGKGLSQRYVQVAVTEPGWDGDAGVADQIKRHSAKAPSRKASSLNCCKAPRQSPVKPPSHLRSQRANQSRSRTSGSTASHSKGGRSEERRVGQEYKQWW